MDKKVEYLLKNYSKFKARTGVLEALLAEEYAVQSPGFLTGPGVGGGSMIEMHAEKKEMFEKELKALKQVIEIIENSLKVLEGKPKLQRVYNLRYKAGYKLTDIAKKLKKTEATIRNYIQAIHEELKEVGILNAYRLLENNNLI